LGFLEGKILIQRSVPILPMASSNKVHLHWQVFLLKTSATLLRIYSILLALPTLGNATQIYTILFVSFCPRFAIGVGVNFTNIL
jgi:hypothetical protein